MKKLRPGRLIDLVLQLVHPGCLTPRAAVLAFNHFTLPPLHGKAGHLLEVKVSAQHCESTIMGTERPEARHPSHFLSSHTI